MRVIEAVAIVACPLFRDRNKKTHVIVTVPKQSAARRHQQVRKKGKSIVETEQRIGSRQIK